jgi:hypothetical protein
MDMRVRSLTQHLKAYDANLYAEKRRDGIICVMRKSGLGLSAPHFIFPLTDNWKIDGHGVEWGIEVVMNRIKAHDLWRDDTFVERWLADEEKEKASRERAHRNSIEAFLYDFRRQFARATNDINTGSMRKLHRKETGYGYCES